MISEDYNIEEVFNELLSIDEDEAFKFCIEGYEETKNPEYLLYRGTSHLVFGEYEDAIECVDNSLSEGCDYYTYAFNIKGEALLELGLYVESRMSFENSLEHKEHQFLTTIFLAELDIREGFYDDAIARCTKYIELHGEDNGEVGELLSIIGWTNMVDLGDRHKAIEAFTEAISRTEECPRAFTGIGIYYVAEKNFTKSIEYFEKAIEIDNTDGENYFGIAICYKELKQYDNILEYLLKANEFETDDSRILMDLGFEMLRQNKIDIAKEYFKEVLIVDPEASDIRKMLEELDIDLGTLK